MTKEQKKLTNDFIEYEKTRGVRSLRKIKYELKVFFEYIDNHGIELTLLKHKDAQNYQTYLSILTDDEGNVHYAVSTVLCMIHAIKCLYNYLKAIGMIPSNPFIGIKWLKHDRVLPRDIPDEKKMNEILTYLKEFWKTRYLYDHRSLYKTHVISELMYSTGLRLNEVSNLEISDIDFDKEIIKVREGKGGKERTAYLNEYTGKVLKIYIDEMREVVNRNNYSLKLFGVNGGKNLDAFLNKHLKKVGERLNVKHFTSHTFRHAVGFHLLRAGCDLRYIQLILGHGSLDTTMIYTKVSKEDLKNELDKYHPRQFVKKEEKNVNEELKV